MTLLHVYFHLRDKQAFRRLLDTSHDRGGTSASSQLSTSAGRSRPRSSVLTMSLGSLVNAKDGFGRTVLHLACATIDTVDYVRLLLAHPSIDVNLPDRESRWTALHRALYNANIQATLLLLQRSEIDTSVKDCEGITPFDLYSMTIRGTHPGLVKIPRVPVAAELFTWGTNKNATLGSGDGGDRAYPDHVILQNKESPDMMQNKSIDARFSPIHVCQLQMSKLHTAVVTSEPQGNLRLCGFGNGGRLGQTQHTQYNLTPLSNFTYAIIAVALGQDHTLALTDAGEVISWGLNRFSQLGYVVEAAPSSLGPRSEELIQVVPRKIASLKKHHVKGITASKSASACWTATEVLVWGANNGQFGFDKTSQPVLVHPRIVTQVIDPVVSICLSDSVMACLLVTHEVLCFWNDRHFKLSFPVSTFPESNRYRPPHANKTGIEKLASCDDVFAALSTNGELFTFSPPAAEGSKEKVRMEPQRVQALKRQYSRIQDIAVGQEGSLIFSTESGHVFVRSRTTSAVSSKTFKFQRIPLLQRVVSVSANNMGAFGALRLEHKVRPLLVTGNKFAQDMYKVEPWLFNPGKWYSNKEGGLRRRTRLDIELETREARREAMVPPKPGPRSRFSFDDDISDVLDDVVGVRKLCDTVEKEKVQRSTPVGGQPWSYAYAHGADILVTLSHGATFPAHRVILSARSSVLRSLLAETSFLKDPQSKLSLRVTAPKVNSVEGRIKAQLSMTGCHPLSLLILLHYLYTDELYAIWDRRVFNTAVVRGRALHQVEVRQEQIISELSDLTRILDLNQTVLGCLRSPVKRFPTATLRKDTMAVYGEVQDMFNIELSYSPQVDEVGTSPPSKRKGKGKAPVVVDRKQDDSEKLDLKSPISPDVVLEFADRRVYCHSVILRARSEFFEAFFDEVVWTEKRVDEGNGVLRLDLRHLRWRVAEFVTRFLCNGEGEEGEMFEVLEFINSVDELLEFMFEVLAAANELLLDRLITLCSIVILKFMTIPNACYILAEASHYHIPDLVQRVQEYITINMEVFLESRMLDALPTPLIEQLSKYVASQQLQLYPLTRSGITYETLQHKWGNWTALQDFPSYIIPSDRIREKDQDKEEVLPKVMTRRPSKGWISNIGSATASPGSSPRLLPQRSGMPSQKSIQEDIFELDMDVPLTAKLQTAVVPTTGTSTPPSTTPGASHSPWKSAVAPRVDIKAIMAEAARISAAAQQLQIPPQRSPQPHSPVEQGSPPALSKRSISSSTSSTGASPSGLAWRTREVPVMPSTPPVSGSSVPPPSTTPPKSGTPANVPATPPRMQRQHSAGAMNSPGLGPVITPMRQVPSKNAGSSKRTVSNPWTMHAPEPTPSPSQSTGMSFLAIQQMEMDRSAGPAKVKQSLVEIQQQEKDKRVEDEFMKWWKEEEERVRLETEQSQAESATPGSDGQQQQRGQRRQRRGQDQGQQVTRPRREPRKSLNTDQNPRQSENQGQSQETIQGGASGSKPQREEGSRKNRKPHDHDSSGVVRAGGNTQATSISVPDNSNAGNAGSSHGQGQATPGGGRHRARPKNPQASSANQPTT